MAFPTRTRKLHSRYSDLRQGSLCLLRLSVQYENGKSFCMEVLHVRSGEWLDCSNLTKLEPPPRNARHSAASLGVRGKRTWRARSRGVSAMRSEASGGNTSDAACAAERDGGRDGPGDHGWGGDGSG
jgi:hypothetical protein